ncbi:GNAT family N-acetyltransferase [Streptomyces mobaraensis NBRC 13819 = DSM 40847]|uniref:GNAT family N-acetyltransferase n=2 Tax=Streptomyces mobaraensis TaxID=35621 RepID=A0A5N5W2I0_STRMB|nr:GNAT family N-acetyltransferase [Streptomyces mobaraensis]EMF02235.1 acetyltransferase [Streptomyces mobaraensis NBRC 13819 = DSM 40847]KAB7836886.1 GNAT family N-acetyltransferase [Streptomyces mobaraensis]QTT72685.1 GNAT family N-acetyltransferase [Streptomyces mobaraensis NBRC 13819 = DSM 40847]
MHPIDAPELTVTTASAEDWRQVVAWATEEGWNPGHGDADRFLPTDPEGFFTGRLGDRIVTAISVVNHGPDYAFLGFYLVAPEQRGRGLGLATWRAAFPHAGTRTVGLDAVPEQEETYKRSGFVPAYRTLRWTGRPARSGTTAAGVHAVTPDRLDAVAAYDRRFFPAERRAFLARWLDGPGRAARVLLRDGRVTGYGLIRPSHDGHRVGPLFADTREDAETLFDALTAHLGPDEEVCLDMPEPNPAAAALAEGRGLTTDWHSIRMYAGPVPGTPAERAFAVTSLELG